MKFRSAARRPPLRTWGAVLTAALVVAGCPAPHAPPPKPKAPSPGLDNFAPAPALPERPAGTPPLVTPADTGSGSAADSVAALVDSPERQWVCRMIDVGIAVGDGRLSMGEFQTWAAQQAVGLVPQGRHRQAHAAVERLIEGDPEALKDLACL